MVRYIRLCSEKFGKDLEDEAAQFRFRLDNLRVLGVLNLAALPEGTDLSQYGPTTALTFEEMEARSDETFTAWEEAEYLAARAELVARSAAELLEGSVELLAGLEDTGATNPDPWPTESPPPKRRHRSPLCTSHASTAPPCLRHGLVVAGMPRHARPRVGAFKT
jgi:hypothetical protein